jgi:hypothetical protein
VGWSWSWWSASRCWNGLPITIRALELRWR